MKLLRFHANNLFSLGDVELDLDRRGLLLVTGHSMDEGGANGSGKSSISNKGIIWTLYGQTASGDKADAVINRFAEEGETASGVVDLESRSGSKYRIIRSRRPSRLTLIELGSNQDLSCRSEKETQVLIDKILGRSRDTFLQTDFFGQGKAANFLDLTAKAQVELLESILPFDQIGELYERTKGYLAKTTVVMTSINRRIDETNGKLMAVQQQERQLSAKLDEWESEQASNIDRITNEIARLETTDTFTAEIEAIKEEINSIPSEEEIKEKIEALTNTLSLTSFAKIKMESENRKTALDLRTLVAVKRPNLNQTCTTCSQPISSDVQAYMISEYETFLDKRLRIEDIINFQEAALVKLSEDLVKYQRQRDECQILLLKHGAIKERSAKLEVERANNPLVKLREELVSVTQDINPYVELYDENSVSVKTLVSSLGFHKQKLQEIEWDQKALEFWQSSFNKELKNEFINQICPVLEIQANRHLEGLGNNQLTIKVSTTKTLKSAEDRSEFTITAMSATGGGTYDALSGGEKQMVNFAIGLALADLAEAQADGPSYFMVLDEPFMALDDRNSENLVNYLNSYLKNKKDTILLISNEDSLKNLIPNRLQVLKENGITRIEDV